jgi:hypothetical protein
MSAMLHEQSLADVVDRLGPEFNEPLGRTIVVLVVRRCRRELDIIAGPAVPEFVERLARQRLTDLLAHSSSASADPGL